MISLSRETNDFIISGLWSAPTKNIVWLVNKDRLHIEEIPENGIPQALIFLFKKPVIRNFSCETFKTIFFKKENTSYNKCESNLLKIDEPTIIPVFLLITSLHKFNWPSVKTDRNVGETPIKEIENVPTCGNPIEHTLNRPKEKRFLNCTLKIEASNLGFVATKRKNSIFGKSCEFMLEQEFDMKSFLNFINFEL